MRAIIYKPARNAMQSGEARTHHWVLEFAAQDRRGIDPLMGWTSSADTQSQVQLRFRTAEEALDYARANGIDAVLREAQPRRHNIRPRGYGENFSPDRRGSWTH